MTNSNRRDWNELSYEILVTILMFLNVGDIAAASMVNKIWNKACHDPSLWHTLDLSIRSSYCLFWVDQMWMASSSLLLKGITLISLILIITLCTCMWVIIYTTFWNNIYKVKIMIRDVYDLAEGIPHGSSLLQNSYIDPLSEQLSLEDRFGNSIYKLFGIIKRIRVFFCRMPNLKWLVLPKKGDFTKVAVDMAMKLWVSLESITLTSVVSRHDIFPTILEYCKKITEMKFSCGYIFDVKHSEAMAKCTPNLKVLSIRVIVATMTALCCVLTSLEHLEGECLSLFPSE